MPPAGLHIMHVYDLQKYKIGVVVAATAEGSKSSYNGQDTPVFLDSQLTLN